MEDQTVDKAAQMADVKGQDCKQPKREKTSGQNHPE